MSLFKCTHAHFIFFDSIDTKQALIWECRRGKGQLISECLLDFLNLPTNQWKNWQISAPESKKWSNQQSKDTFLQYYD